jgi:hypothetical protein
MTQAHSVAATFVLIVHRPDALIRPSSSSPWTGNNIYSPTGVGETVSKKALRGATVTYFIGAQNDGNVRDALIIDGPGSIKGFSIHYYRGTTNVTGSVVQGTYSTGLLLPGKTRVIRMTVTIGNKVPHGTVKSWLVKVTSRGITDSVNAKLKVS